jgi:hypothetical protein
MMGQFVVVDPTAVTNLPAQNFDFQVFPNPSSDRIYLDFKGQNISAYYVTISTINGRALLMLPQPILNDGIDISEIPAGTYVLTLIDKKTKQASSVKFVKK